MKIGMLCVACGSLGWGGWTLKNEELIMSVVCCEELIVLCSSREELIVRRESLGKGSWRTNN